MTALDARSFVRWVQTFIPGSFQDLWWDGRQGWNRMLHLTHEREFEALSLFRLPTDAHILDLGANRGQSIDSIRAVLGGDVQITAVEASKRLADRLVQRYPDIRVIHAAVGDGFDTITLHTPSYRGFRYDGLASCDPDYATYWFQYSMWRFDQRHVSIDTETVAVAAVDDMDVTADFVKIDVQGMELLSLLGMVNLLERDRPIVMIETPELPVFAFFARHGYEPRWYVYDEERGACWLTADTPEQFTLNTFFVPR